MKKINEAMVWLMIFVFFVIGVTLDSCSAQQISSMGGR